MTVRLTFVGSGDAFGAGGRFQTCLHLEADSRWPLLVDCGATSLVAMRRRGIAPSDIGAVVTTHLHGDHFGGIPFLILDGQFRGRRRPLLVAGPPGIDERLGAAMEVLFPGSATTRRKFEVSVIELAPRTATEIGPATVTGVPVDHASGAPAYALRVHIDDKTIAYSGDTQWTETLPDVARGADVFICEAYFFDRQIRHHLDYRTLMAHRHELDCPRIILTHRSDDMDRHAEQVELECAEDGMALQL